MAVTITRGARIQKMKDFHRWSKTSGMTQKQIAKKLGVHPRFLRKLFVGQHAPNEDIYAKVMAMMYPLIKKPKTRARGYEKPKPKKASRHAGRVPNKWSLLQPADLLDYERRHQLTQSEMAARCQVSKGCYRNWTSGANAPNLNTQRELRSLLRADRTPTLTTSHIAPLFVGPERSTSHIEPTVKIVKALIASGEPMTPDQLVDVTRRVADVLRSPL